MEDKHSRSCLENTNFGDALLCDLLQVSFTFTYLSLLVLNN